MWLRFRVFLVAFLLVVALVIRGESLSYAGLADVRGPFEHVDRMGHAFYMLKLGDAGRLPIYAYWSSEAGLVSRSFGHGWCIPLLESRIYPVSSSCLRLRLPDGYVRHFHKRKDGSYSGGRFWTATEDGHTTRVIADSGDGFPRTVLSFVRGRLAKMECEEGAFEFKEDTTGLSVVSKGRKILTVAADAANPDVVTVRLGGTRIRAEKRPAAVFFAPGEDGSQPVKGEAKSLSSLEFSSGERHTFEYGGDESRASFTADRLRVEWSPATRKILTAGGFDFEIGADPSDGVSGPGIARVGPDGARESYSYEVGKGLITVESSNGVKTVSRLFTSGDNAGKLRWRERYSYGVCEERVDFIYDKSGKILDRIVRRERK